MKRSDPTPEECAAWAAERAAVLQCALRHVAAAWHRQHANEKVLPWTRCPDHFCSMAHDAVEGRYTARTRTAHGRVISLQRKEA